LRQLGLRARVLTVKIKYANHQRTSRRATLEHATTDGRVLGPLAQRLLALVPDVETRGVRLTGVSLSGLGPEDATRQLRLDVRGVARSEELGKVLDRIADRFGKKSVRRAVLLD